MKFTLLSPFLKRNFDFIIAFSIIAAFIAVASYNLATVPVPETDEAHMLNMSYEVVYRGQLSRPMYRYLGGNIENAWHSFTPLYYVLLGGFQKITGWGVVQGRAFNLIFSALVLVMVYLTGRRMFGWKAGLTALVLLVADQTFFERSRLLRNDFPAAFFALLAFYLYEKAEEKKLPRNYIAAGLAAGAAVMCHTNAIYMLGGIGILMLLKEGWRVITQKKIYYFSLSALAVMAYEIIFALVDYKNLSLQYRDDKLHFGVFENWGFIKNLLEEPRRYASWAGGGEMFLNVPRTTLHIFQLLAIAALLYLMIYALFHVKRGLMNKPQVRLLIISLVATVFHACIASHKEIYYMAHIVPWLALSVGAMTSDMFDFLLGAKDQKRTWAFASRKLIVAVAVIFVLAFALQAARQYRRYLREAANPELARFDEVKTVLRDIVPQGVCPVAIKSPVMFLAFPDHDRCFASIENRMKEALDLDGNEYAVIVPSPYDKARLEWTDEFDLKFPLIGELRETAYGTIRIYYTGTREQYRSLEPQTFYFLGDRRGHVSTLQLEQAREVWAIGAGDALRVYEPPRLSNPIDLSSVALKPDTFYQLVLNCAAGEGNWQVLVIDETSGALAQQIVLDRTTAHQEVRGLFKTMNNGQVKLMLQHFGRSRNDILQVQTISIREVAE